MRIKKLCLRNYTSHVDTTLTDLEPVTALVGPNGGGKSSLFEGIRTFSRILAGPVGQAFGPAPYSFDDKVFRGADPREIEFEAEFDDLGVQSSVNYKIKLGYSGVENVGAPPSVLDEVVELGTKKVFDRAAKDVSVKGIKWSDVKSELSLLAMVRQQQASFQGPVALKNLTRSIGSVVNYRLEPHRLALPSQEPELDGPVRMGYEGDNLAGLLYWLDQKDPPRLKKIVDDIQQIVPEIVGISFNAIGVDRVGYSIKYGDARGNVLAPNASSGTVLILGLVALLNAPTKPNVVCIEEPETGLTPDAVRLFFRLLCGAATPGQRGAGSHTQFFFSSHSPFVLVDAWNSISQNRGFIKRIHVDSGQSVAEDIQAIIDRGDSGAVLQKGKDGRTIMGLKTAEELMCGRFL